MLDWPGVPMPKKRRPHVPAAWTLPSASEWEAAAHAAPGDTNTDDGEESESGQPKIATGGPAARMAPLVADVTAHVQAGLASMEIAA